MTINVDALWGLVALVALVAFAYGPWQWVCTDYCRQILFEKRDALFDLAHAGKLDFSSAEYLALRQSLEALIRFCHEVTLARLLYFLFSRWLWKGTPEARGHISTAIRKVHDNEIRQGVSRLFREAHLTIAAMIIFKSPILLLLLLALSPAGAVAILGAIAIGALRRWWSAVENAAEIIGDTVQAEADTSPFAVAA
jgi:hypothetical protein